MGRLPRVDQPRRFRNGRRRFRHPKPRDSGEQRPRYPGRPATRCVAAACLLRPVVLPVRRLRSRRPILRSTALKAARRLPNRTRHDHGGTGRVGARARVQLPERASTPPGRRRPLIRPGRGGHLRVPRRLRPLLPSLPVAVPPKRARAAGRRRRPADRRPSTVRCGSSRRRVAAKTCSRRRSGQAGPFRRFRSPNGRVAKDCSPTGRGLLPGRPGRGLGRGLGVERFRVGILAVRPMAEPHANRGRRSRPASPSSPRRLGCRCLVRVAVR
jgi:hypothetical protein